jgi:ubiquinone biosynthesis accessory factor UbiK
MDKNPFASFPPLPKPLADFQEKLGELVKTSPAAEMEKHMKAALAAALSKMEVVTQEEFDIQTQMLSRALEKLSVLEKRVAELESRPKS